MPAAGQLRATMAADMANADWLAELADVSREIDEDLELLIGVALHRRTGPVDPTTGRQGFADPVTVDAKIEGVSAWRVGGEATLASARYTVTLYGQAVAEGDKLVWDEENHLVLRIMGLLKDADGQRYTSKALVT